MGGETMLYSQRAFPEKLRAAGFQWHFENLADVLHHELISSRSDRWGNTSWR
jgi:NAD dependent epimerase/dehydratase family enzyme